MAEISEEALPKTLRAMSPKEANLILVAGGAWLLTGLFKRSSLIDPIPWPVTYLAALAGFGLGAWISWRILKRSTGKLDRRSIIAIITLPLFSLFFATFLARTAYEGLKYGGAQTATALAEAKVISKDTKWNRRAFVTFGPNTRDISVRINAEVHSNLEPWRQPGRDCLLLEVETGREGIRRAISPNVFESSLGMNRYRNCENSHGS